MVDADLMTVLDQPWPKGGKNGRYSCRDGEVWYVVQYGPGFCNTFRVTDYDNAGLRWLKRIEWKEEQRAKDRAL